MPIYEYNCQDCHADFELLVRASTALECPHCHSTQLDKKLSVFSTAQGGAASAGPEACMSAMASGGCGACGAAHAGACGLH